MSKYEDLYVVGIGASAGGFEAFQKFLPKLSHTSNISYVITQHLDPKQPTLFGELLSKFSSLQIIQIKDGQKIEPDKIYYCPPNKDVVLQKGTFILTEPEVKSYPKPSVNKFLHSLALEKKDKAVGIILSGTGSDGAKGINSIAQYGGIALSEDEGAKYYSMPKAAIDTGKVLASLPPELLAEGIEHIIVDRKFFDKHFALQDSTAKIFEILNKKTDIDFSSYKEATITRRIKKRMNETKSRGVDGYLEILESDKEEVEKLKDELLIIVTSFFRDTEAFGALKKELYNLVKNKVDNTIRIWVAGCATGEEAYTIAIILCELFEELKITKKVTIFATDVSEKTINQSRNRFYTLEQVADVDKRYLKKYFDCSNDIFKPNKMLRDMIVFSKHDLIKDPPFLNLDMVSCRNLLIYFDTELQKRILSIFYYTMRYESILFLGKSETVGVLGSLFSIVDNRYKIYKKLNDLGNIDIETLTYVKKNNFVKTQVKKQTQEEKTLDVDISINKAISNKYAHSGIVIDGSNYNILFFKGDCSEFVGHPQGIQTSDIFRLIIDSLKLDLRATINEAKRQGVFASSKKIRIHHTKEPKEYVTIGVFPLEKNKLGESTLFVTFTKEIDEKRSIEPKFFDPIEIQGENVSILEEELSSLKERLQITIEELETSNEELQSTNEELQSTNEELQSTNEELETSNEELQSTNEELQTVNDELSYANYELEFANKAFNNALSNLDTYVLILDKKLNIVKHTDGIIKFFDLSKSHDTNFSSVIMNSTIELPNLLEDIKMCLLNNKSVEYNIEYNNRYYYFSIKRIDISVENKTNLDEGIVLSFVDKTDIIQKDQILFQQSKMASMGEMIGNIAHQWRQPLNNLSLSITHFIDKIENDDFKDNDIAKFKEKYKNSIITMNDTIDEFKNFFQVDNQKTTIDVCNSIKQSISMIDDSLKFHNIAIDFKDHICPIYEGKKTELSQVVLNIITNSKDAFVINDIKNGKINIEVRETKDDIFIDISDNAGGVSESIISKLCDPYFTTKENKGGSGIGLYMSSMILQQIGGSLQMQNYKSGLKTTITIPKGVKDA